MISRADKKRYEQLKQIWDLVLDEINVKALHMGLYTEDGRKIAYERKSRRFVILEKTS